MDIVLKYSMATSPSIARVRGHNQQFEHDDIYSFFLGLGASALESRLELEGRRSGLRISTGLEAYRETTSTSFYITITTEIYANSNSQFCKYNCKSRKSNGKTGASVEFMAVFESKLEHPRACVATDSSQLGFVAATNRSNCLSHAYSYFFQPFLQMWGFQDHVKSLKTMSR